MNNMDLPAYMMKGQKNELPPIVFIIKSSYPFNSHCVCPGNHKCSNHFQKIISREKFPGICISTPSCAPSNSHQVWAAFSIWEQRMDWKMVDGMVRNANRFFMGRCSYCVNSRFRSRLCTRAHRLGFRITVETRKMLLSLWARQYGRYSSAYHFL